MFRDRRASSVLLICCLAASAAALFSSVSAARASIVSPALRSADHARDRSDRALVSKVHKQRSCTRSTSGRCRAYRRAMQRAGRKLASAERRFAMKSVVTQRRAQLYGRQQAPRLRGKRGRLMWSRVADIRTYLVIRKTPGMKGAYSVVKRLSLKPPAIPGQTVTYRVRTAVKGSAWSKPLPVTYFPKPRKDPESAPIVTVSGRTLSWSRVGRVRDYVVVRKVPGRPDVYSAVRGTSAATTPVPGATAYYSVRTAVTGSAPSPQVSITFPVAAAATTPAPAAPATPGFQVALGVRVNEGDDAKSIATVKPKVVRFEFDAANPSTATYWVDFYRARGVTPQPLAGFDSIPTDAEVDALAAWARGQAGKIRLLEFGNETYIHLSSQGGAYARAAKRLGLALAGSGVGVLIQADDNNSGSSWWVDAMYQAVPDLHKYAAGWVIHPYGPPSVNLARINKVWAMVNKYGGGGVKFYATEFGMATDNGRTLSDNFGYPANLSYAQAGTLLTQAIDGFRSSGKVAQVMLYQSTDQRASGTSGDREHYFGVLQAGGGLKGAYTQAAIAALAHEAHGRSEHRSMKAGRVIPAPAGEDEVGRRLLDR